MKKKILNTVLSKVSSAVINFLLVIVLSQALGAAGRGEATLILTTIAFLIIACEFAGGGSLVYLLPRNDLRSLLLTSYTWSVGICISAYVLIHFIFPEYKIYDVHISLIAFLYSATGIHTKVLIAREEVSKNNIIQLVQVIMNLMTLLILFFIFQEKTIIAYIVSLYVSAISAYLLSLVLIATHVKENTGQVITWTFGKILRYGAINQTAHITQFLSWRISYYFIEEFWGDNILGVYSNGVSIAESIWLISRSVALVQYSRIANTEDDTANRMLTIRLTKFTSMISFIMLVPLLLLPSSFYTLLFGPEFYQLSSVVWYLAPGILFFEFALIIGHYFSGTGNYGVNAIASATGLIITMLLGLLLIPVYPLAGAGLVASISYFATAIVVVIFFFKNHSELIGLLLPTKSDLRFFVDQWKSINPLK